MVFLAAGGGGGGGVLPFEAAGGGGGGVFPFPVGGGGGTFDPVAAIGAFGGGLCPFGAYFEASFLASFGVSFLSVVLAPVVAFLSPPFLSVGLVSVGFSYFLTSVAGTLSFPFLCLPVSKTVSSGRI